MVRPYIKIFQTIEISFLQKVYLEALYIHPIELQEGSWETIKFNSG